ncbi:MAG TPA: PH domain-containing protein [Gaiellaceae bacterium]|nr:PH domain-containing protein [Gaiellaceae bacterium]
MGDMNDPTRYDDGGIVCDESGLIIRRYYPWGSKRIPYSAIRSVKRLPIRIRRWRLFGSGDFMHWWNLDLTRPKKSVALDIDIGRFVHPTITPNDPDAVERLITEHATRTHGMAGRDPGTVRPN